MDVGPLAPISSKALMAIDKIQKIIKDVPKSEQKFVVRAIELSLEPKETWPKPKIKNLYWISAKQIWLDPLLYFFLILLFFIANNFWYALIIAIGVFFLVPTMVFQRMDDL